MQPVERSADPVRELTERVERLGANGNRGGLAERKDLLKFLEDNKVRDPSLVVKFGGQMVEKYASKLGDDVWEICEEVLISALDSGDHKTAEKMFRRLAVKFEDPSAERPSLRLKKLEAMILECCGKFKEAQKIYIHDILKHDPVNQHALRRIACIFKAAGELPTAVKKLNQYLQLFSGDVNGWLELAEIYVSMSSYECAKFCYEEAILIEPENYLYTLLYADTLYSLGNQRSKKAETKNCYDLARQYYIQSLELCPGNVRALYGLAMCLRIKTPGQTRQKGLYQWTNEQIVTAYAEAGKEGRALLEIVEGALRQ